MSITQLLLWFWQVRFRAPSMGWARQEFVCCVSMRLSPNNPVLVYSICLVLRFRWNVPCPAHSLTLAAIAFASTQGKHVESWSPFGGQARCHEQARQVLVLLFRVQTTFACLFVGCLVMVVAFNIYCCKCYELFDRYLVFLLVVFCLHAQADLARLHAFVVVPGDCWRRQDAGIEVLCGFGRPPWSFNISNRNNFR